MRPHANGFSLVELLVGTLLASVVAGAMAGFMASLAHVAVDQPAVADRQQRLRSAVEQLSEWIARSGQQVGGRGDNEGALLVPALYPQRRGVSRSDPETSAFVDRLTLVSGAEPAAVARLGISMSSAAAPLVIDTSDCGAGWESCGFAPGVVALVAQERGAGEWFTVRAAANGLLEHQPAALAEPYSVEARAIVTAVDVKAIAFDVGQRQLRLATPGIDLPLLDGVSAFSVRWFGDPRPPRAPRPPPGEENCVLDAAGTPTLPELAAGHGPWVELSVPMLSDGPWCGTSPWRFDADLLRVRLIRFTLGLEASVGGHRDADAVSVVDVAPATLRR
jgi:Tfp pilus assembly protein PilW